MKRFLLVFCLLFSGVLCSQNVSVDTASIAVNSATQRLSNSATYLKSYWDSGLTVLSQPLHYDWKDWTAFGGVAASTTLAFVYDDEIYGLIDRTFDDNVGRLTAFTDVFGEEYFILPCIVGTYAISAINKDCRLRNMSLAVLQSFVYAEVASAGLKVLTCRMRPSDSDIQHPTSNIQNWLGPFATFESTSFPSGHAMRSFAVATTLAGFYPEKIWVGIVSYSVASLCSFGRLVAEEHWTSDVLLGAALGYFIGRGVVKFNNKIGNITSVDIQTVATNYGLGIVINF